MLLSWKERVANKLSRLLADSPSSSPPTDPRPDRQGILLGTEEVCSPKKSKFSYIISFLPTINSAFHGHSSDVHDKRLMSLRSKHGRWQANGFGSEERPLEFNVDSGTESENDDVFVTPKTNPIDVSDVFSSINGNDGNEEVTPSHDSQEFQSYLTDKSVFMNSDLFDFFQSSLPNIAKGCQWILLYSTLKHGISLRTLLRNSNNIPGPCLLIAGDTQGVVFGGLLDCPLNPTAKRKYQGTNQTFVFTTLYGEPRLFRPTGANRYYYLCLNDLLAFGGGSNFALCLDEDLLHGSSGLCETFGNLCLAHSPEFELKNVELWGFTHSSLCCT
ncbi:putative TLDc domain-containing protein [Dioscorea sansibarensis]